MNTASPPVLVTIARQLGSGGSYLGQRLARRLGSAYLDRQILRLAAEELGVEEGELAGQDERAPGFWSRMFEVFAGGCPDDVYSPPPIPTVNSKKLFAVEQAIIRRMAAEGPCVIVGHGAFTLFRERPAVLNVFIHAARAFRIERARRFYHMRDAAEAGRLLDRSDRDRARFMTECCGLRWADATNYDLALDTSRLGLETAEAILIDCAQRIGVAAAEPTAPAPD